MRRAIFWTAGIGIILFFSFSALVASKVPTANDARASSKIFEEFTGASTNIVNNKRLEIRFSPRRRATRLIVYGKVSTVEQQALNELAIKISQNNSNRPISIEFREEVQQGTNN
jgi:hypothetical protein